MTRSCHQNIATCKMFARQWRVDATMRSHRSIILPCKDLLSGRSA